ncbi:putative BIR domain-containing protein [Namao virus]|nr:putative BIR domain-containing protein [Namao virus]
MTSLDDFPPQDVKFMVSEILQYKKVDFKLYRDVILEAKNQTIMDLYYKNHSYGEFQQRLSTYATWPRDNVNIEVLAQSGFYYIGLEDCVKCFCCEGGLKNWERVDCPWMEHAKWFPNCDFLIKIRGKKYVDSIQKTFMKFVPSDLYEKKITPFKLKMIKAMCELGYDKVEVERFIILSTKMYASKEELIIDIAASNIKKSPCIEHTDLTHRLNSVEQELQRIKESKTCKICLDEEIKIVFMPCRHSVSCIKCSNLIGSCPMCRSVIVSKIIMYMC